MFTNGADNGRFTDCNWLKIDGQVGDPLEVGLDSLVVGVFHCICFCYCFLNERERTRNE